mmetsp:Transcript_38539/g.86020  ORF Transcript_38539/g.86020 Transcript_38539/m.86020 type:complete len:292 (-) Transcript_38539:84-959(-)
MRPHGGAHGLVRPKRIPRTDHPLPRLLSAPRPLLRGPTPVLSPPRRRRGGRRAPRRDRRTRGGRALRGRNKPLGPSGNVDADVPRAPTDERAHQDTVSGEVPVRRSPNPDNPGRYPPGHGDEPLPDYQSRASWHLISTHGAQMRPKAREVWRFLVEAALGSLEPANKRWIQVLIPPGQERRLFAARPELRIPGAAPMTYVDDPTPAVVPCWYDGDDDGPGYESLAYSPPRLVLDAWGRIPAQKAAAAAGAAPRADAEVDWGSAEMQARYSYLPDDDPLALFLARKRSGIAA